MDGSDCFIHQHFSFLLADVLSWSAVLLSTSHFPQQTSCMFSTFLVIFSSIIIPLYYLSYVVYFSYRPSSTRRTRRTSSSPGPQHRKTAQPTSQTSHQARRTYHPTN